jgi:hypothetical protein
MYLMLNIHVLKLLNILNIHVLKLLNGMRNIGQTAHPIKSKYQISSPNREIA